MMAKAEVLIRDVRAWTGVPGAPLADWVAVSGSRIMAVGSGDGAGVIGAATLVIEGRAGSLLPGLNDAHLHLFPGGLALSDLDLSGVKGRDALAQKLAEYRRGQPGLSFVSAFAADYDLLSDDRMPDRAALDVLCPDLPLLIMAVDFHTAWANTAALALAGITRGADLAPGSSVVLDEQGLATGTLLEFGAIDLVRRCNPLASRHSKAAQRPLEPIGVPHKEREADKAVFRAALHYCASLGLTAVQNMDGSLYQLELLFELDRDEGLPLRVRTPFHVQPGDGPEVLSHAVAWRERFQSDKLTCDFVKIFADGVIDSGTAHLLAPYAHRPDHRGAALIPDDRMQAIVTEADRLGFQIAVHCVGDGAVRQVLDAFAVARAANGWRTARHRIEHVELIDPADIARMAELGVVASMQPTHVPDPGDGYLRQIGAERSRYAFAVADLRRAGVQVVLSTDWPVAPLDPFLTLQAATSRACWPGGTDHRIGLTDAVEGVTRAAAWVAFDEDRRGTLTPGALADLVLLDRDLWTDAAPEVRLTLCDGRATHDPEGLTQHRETAR